MSAKTSSHKTYIFGFLYSVILTLTAYYLVINEILSGWNLAFLILGLAVAQLAVQLFYFLHLGQEKKPRWKLTSFFFAVMVVFIVVFGSIWIMVNLSYHHGHNKSSEQVDQDIEEDEIINKKDLR